MKILQTIPLQNKTEAPKPTVVDTTVATPDLEKEIVNDSTLDEAAGSNEEVEKTAETIMEMVGEWVASKAYEIVDELGKATHFRFTDPKLSKTAMGSLIIEVVLKKNPKFPLIGLTRALIGTFGRSFLITLELGYGERFEALPKHHQVRNLNRIIADEDSHLAFVHELTHAFEEKKRKANGAPSIFDDNTGRLSAFLQEDPILNNIGRRIYLIDAAELNARVAEVGSIMRQADPGATKEELVAKIKESRVWKEILFLMDFPGDAVYMALVKRVQQKFADSIPEGDFTALEAKIAEAFRNALIKLGDEAGGRSRTYQKIKKILTHKLVGDKPEIQIKGVRDILFNLEELFAHHAEILKRRVIKTITLARKQEVPVEEPEMELAEGEALSEAYPEGFDMGEFRDLRNFTQRIKYCEEKLKRIKSGSSRIVYDVDGQKVLKLAKNTKGIAQNETEASYDFQNFYGDYVTKLFDSHPEDLWVEMEKANPITPGKFKQLVGVSMEELGRYLVNKFMSGSDYEEDPHLSALCDDNDFVVDIAEMVGEMELHPGDMGRASTWGLVVRNGKEMPVVVDFGITQKNFPVHYR